MGRCGLTGRSKRRFKTTTIADPAAGTVPTDHLRRAFTPASVELDQAWVGDITYLRT
jgi:transposase InsO family protein